MLGNIVRLVGGPLAVVVTVAELVMATNRVVEALQGEEDDDDEEWP